MGSCQLGHGKVLWPEPPSATAGLMGRPGTEQGEQLEASMPTQGKFTAKLGCSQPEGGAHGCTCLTPAGRCQVLQAAKKKARVSQATVKLSDRAPCRFKPLLPHRTTFS